MNKRTALCLVMVGFGLSMIATPASAHHSLVAQFDVNKPVVLRGTVTKLQWFNPHGWIHVDVTRAGGTIEHWQIETGSPRSMLRRGLTASDLEPGTDVIIRGFSAKDGSRMIAGRIVTFPAREGVYPDGEVKETTFELGR